nr:MAG TPA: hypothetical protein [Caudoviricetes sp.]
MRVCIPFRNIFEKHDFSYMKGNIALYSHFFIFLFS